MPNAIVRQVGHREAHRLDLVDLPAADSRLCDRPDRSTGAIDVFEEALQRVYASRNGPTNRGAQPLPVRTRRDDGFDVGQILGPASKELHDHDRVEGCDRHPPPLTGAWFNPSSTTRSAPVIGTWSTSIPS